jgi:sarcosine oxidase
MRIGIIGGGVIGLATSYKLLKSGVDVICYDKQQLMSDRSAGSSRIFRLAHEQPDLVEIAIKSRRIFRSWEEYGSEQMISDAGLVISGGELEDWAASMAAAGARYEIADGCSESLRLPTHRLPNVALIDPGAGVIRVAAVAKFLVRAVGNSARNEYVYAIDSTTDSVRVWTSRGSAHFDAVVICAGSGTSPLAAQVDICVPSALAHHLRLTFRLREEIENLRSWITRSPTGMSTYQHTNTTGQWAVGAHIDPKDSVWEVGRDHAVRVSRAAVRNYVASYLDMVEPNEIDELYCTITPELGDGYKILRSGRVLAIYGANLFKLAPVIGESLAQATLDGSTPTSLGTMK